MDRTYEQRPNGRKVSIRKYQTFAGTGFDFAGIAFIAAFILSAAAWVFRRRLVVDAEPKERSFSYLLAIKVSTFVRFSSASVLTMYLSTL